MGYSFEYTNKMQYITLVSYILHDTTFYIYILHSTLHFIHLIPNLFRYKPIAIQAW